MTGSCSGGFEIFIGSAVRYSQVPRCGEEAGDMRMILSFNP